MPRLGALLAILLCARAGHAVRMDAAAALYPRNGTGLGRAVVAAAMVPLLSGAPGAGAFDLDRPTRAVPPGRADRAPGAVATGDYFGRLEQEQPMEDWLRKVPSQVKGLFRGLGQQLNWDLQLPQLAPASEATRAWSESRAPPEADVSRYSIGGGMAVKEIRASTPEAIRKAENEVQALQLFAGGDVVKLVDAKTEQIDRTTVRAYIVTEAAESMQQSLMGQGAEVPGVVPEDQKIRMIVEMLRGLSKLEEAGWAHRDIKPENILVFGKCFSSEGCHAKLSEFSQACPIGSLNARGDDGPPALVGSPRYIAPEVWSGKGELSSKMDVWSMGIVAFELLTGSPPALLSYEGDSPLEQHRFRSMVPQTFDIAADPGYQELKKRDRELAELIHRMLTRTARRRPSVAQALKHARRVAKIRGVEVPEQQATAGVSPALAVADPSVRKTTLYRSRSGNIVKEIHARGVRAARSAELELEALQLFGGGDVIALMDSKVKRLGEDGAFVSLEVEAADGNLRRQLLDLEGTAAEGIELKHKSRILVELLRGLAKMERGGWVHGDIRPEHVLVFGNCFSERGCHAKLGGLSRARPLDAIDAEFLAEKRDQVVYVAPELFQEGGDLRKMDVFAMGVVAFELFAGSFPGGGTQSLGRYPLQTMAPGDFIVADPRFHELERHDSVLAKLIRRMLTTSVAHRPDANAALVWAKRVADRYRVATREQGTRKGTSSVAPRRKRGGAKVYPVGAGMVVKEIGAPGGQGTGAHEVAALERFGGGDIVKLLTSQTKSLGDWHTTYLLYLEAADGNLEDGLMEKERGLLLGVSEGVPRKYKVRIVAELLRGVTRLEKAGWVHGDITPSNVLVFGECFSPDGCHVKLADFGNARTLASLGEDAQREARIALSAPRYAAPEVFRGQGDLSKVDVWSVGMLAFELFVGRLPQAASDPALQGRDAEDSPALISDEELSRDPGFRQLLLEDAQLANFIRRMLTTSVPHRPKAQTAYEWARALAKRHGVALPEQGPA